MDNSKELAAFLEQVANGINPVTGKPDNAENILNEVIVVRALFNAAAVLRTDSTSIHQKVESSRENINCKDSMVKFYRVSGKYGFLSNFSKYNFNLEHKVWATSEHYFQAKKFEGTPHEEEIRLAATPNQAAKMGRQRRRPLRADWEQKKEDIMLTALRAKFEQNPEIKSLLIETGDSLLIEHTKNDSYWGDGGDGTGRNRLGELLMLVRDELTN